MTSATSFWHSRRDLVQQLLRLRVGEQVGHVVLDDLGQVGRDDGAGIDHGQALEQRLLAVVLLDPHGGQAECRLHRRLAGQRDRLAARVHHQQHVGPDIAAPEFDFLDPHHIGVGRKLEVVLNADRRQDESDLARELAAQTLDLVGQAEALIGRIDQRQQGVAQFQPDRVDRQGGPVGSSAMGAGAASSIVISAISFDWRSALFGR